MTAINTIRCLAIDMVQAANSGHPGAPMGQAALAHTLWSRYLRFDPQASDWANRDRFVLSCGHASALLYSLLHLSGFDLPLDELRNFRQLGSKTPGHPEYGHTDGVETTTGPLGQGVGNAVGMAIAERLLAEHFNRDGFDLFDHRVWALASDGDLMEGVASEACSLAGHLGLGKLNLIWDDNRITIDGPTDLSFTENVQQRFEAYGWHTVTVTDGNDVDALSKAYEEAIAETSRPSLIAVRTHIGFGSPAKQDTSSAHGSPLGKEEALATKHALGWPYADPFQVPEEAKTELHAAAERGHREQVAWQAKLSDYRKAHPEIAAEFDRRAGGDLPEGWQSALPTWKDEDKALASRKASGLSLNGVAPLLPELTGGSADLAGSNNTDLDGVAFQSRSEPGGRNFNFGVREHAMGALLNGMALSGLLRPYAGTFLVFSDYMRPSIRLAALMGLPVIYIFTHDSIFVGEDGPTHQPEGHLASLRAIAGLVTLRPADSRETAAAWKVALERTDGPTALILTRQTLPHLAGSAEAIDGVARGGYTISDSKGAADVVLIATGSEVAVAVDAQTLLAESDIDARVVSLPSWELFEQQDADYRSRLLGPIGTPRLAIEAALPNGWERYTGDRGAIHSMTGYGASAPAEDLAVHFGFTAEAVAANVQRLLAG